MKISITVQKKLKDRAGKLNMFLTFKDSDLARKKWSMSITEAKNPAKMISPTSAFFLIPMTIAHDHMPITP